MTFSFKRRDIGFRSGDESCSAWLYRPETPTPPPVIVMAHGLGGVRTMRLDAFAERFAAAGYACLVFDYRHFGESGGEPRQLLDITRQREDWAAAVRCARALPELDGTRVVLWGTSFAGGHVLVVAAADQAVTAVISQCPFTSGLASSLAHDPRSAAQVTLLALRDRAGALFGRAPVMVKLAGAPHSAAMMSAPDAAHGYLRLMPRGSAIPNQVAARIALDLPRDFPGRKAAELRCPVLFCICEPDSVAPSAAALRDARRAPRGEVLTYPYGHFDIYVDAPFEHVVRDQLAFLARHVPAPA